MWTFQTSLSTPEVQTEFQQCHVVLKILYINASLLTTGTEEYWDRLYSRSSLVSDASEHFECLLLET